MQTWFDAQLDQKILDGIYSAAAECGSNFLPTITVSNDNEW